MTSRLLRGAIGTLFVLALTVGEASGPPARGTAARSALNGADVLRRQNERGPLESSVKTYKRALDLARREGQKDVEALALLGQGLAWTLLGYFDDARPPLKEALVAFHALHDRAHEAEALTTYARVLTMTGDPTAGVSAIEDAVGLARESGDRRVEAEALSGLGWSGREAIGSAAARAAAEEAIAIDRAMSNQSGLSSALNGLGFLVATDHGAEAARPYYEEALHVARAAGDARETGTALTLLGYSTNDVETAIAFFQESLPLSRRAGDHFQEIETLNGLGTKLYYSGRNRQALACFQDALAVSLAIKSRSTEGFLINNVAAALSALGQTDRLGELYQQALDIHRANHDQQEEAKTLLGLASVRAMSEDYSGEFELASQALALSRQVRNGEVESKAQLTIGLAATSLGRYSEGIAAYTAALEIARQRTNVQAEAETERWLAQVLVLLGDRNQALEHVQHAVTLAEQAGLKADLVAAMAQAATIQAEEGEISAARRLLDSAAVAVKNLADPVLEARVYNGAASLQLGIGNTDEAIHFLGLELDAWNRAGDRRGEASAFTQLAKAYAAEHDMPQAFDYLKRALISSRAAHTPAYEAIALTALMELWRQQGQASVAVFYGKQAINLFQQTRANLLQLDRSIQRTYVQSRAQIYRELADLLITAGRLPEAQQVLNLLKEEEYFDFIRRDGKEAPAARRIVDLNKEETVWEARYREIVDRVAEIGWERGELLAIKNRKPEEETRLAALNADLVVANQAFASAMDQLIKEAGLNNAAGRVAEIKDAQGLMDTLRDLGPGVVALYTVVLPERYRVILITADARKVAQASISKEDLGRRIIAFRQALENPRIDPRPAARELYKVLVGPIAADLEQAHAQTLMWSLDGMLRYVPFAALYDGQQYLVERYRTVVFTPASESRLKDLPKTAWTGLGVGVSHATPGFSALPAVPDELRSIFRRAPDSPTGVLDGRILLDESFTEDAFLAGLRNRAPVVHVASHFQFHPGDENDSFLLLGDGGHLTLGALRLQPQLFSGVELLTISACNTAVGDSESAGAEVESFGVEAQRQGAKAVVAGLWSVADQGTRVLMEDFYRARVQGGVSKAEALRAAQLALLRGTTANNDPGRPASAPANRSVTLSGTQAQQPFVVTPNAPWSHPFYWAPFILIGNWR